MSPFSKIANQVINHSTLVPGNNNAPGKHVPVPLLLPPSPRSGNTDRKPPKERKLDYISLFKYFVMLSKNYYTITYHCKVDFEEMSFVLPAISLL